MFAIVAVVVVVDTEVVRDMSRAGCFLEHQACHPPEKVMPALDLHACVVLRCNAHGDCLPSRALMLLCRTVSITGRAISEPWFDCSYRLFHFHKPNASAVWPRWILLCILL